MSFTVVRKPCTDPYMTITGVTFDSSYGTGGEALTASDLGWNNVQCVWAQPKGGLDFVYDPANAKLLAYLGTTDSSGIFVYAPGGGDLKGATAITAAMGTSDQAADAVNAGTWIAYQTFTTVSGAAGSLGTITLQPGTARNVVVTVKNDSGGSLNLYTGSMTFAVVGTFRGAAQTETITCTLTGGQVAVANTPKYRAWQGVKPFDTITTITQDATSLAAIAVADGALKVGVGPGTILGLPIDGDTGADADIIKATLSAANYSISGKTNWTNQTIDFGTTADGWDCSVEYKVDAESISGTAYGTSYALPEVPSTTDLSGLGEVLVFAVGQTKA